MWIPSDTLDLLLAITWRGVAPDLLNGVLWYGALLANGKPIAIDDELVRGLLADWPPVAEA